MIRTSKNKLRNTIAKQYISMLAESRNLSEEEIQEISKWWKERQKAKQAGKGMSPAAPPAQAQVVGKPERPAPQKPQRPGRVDVGGGAEILEPDVADFEQQLGSATWMSDDPEEFAPSHRAAKTQTDMRTVDIGGSKRPYAKKVGLAESQLRAIVSDMIIKSLK